MQRQLMLMFFADEHHSLRKEDICQALWPKQLDASDTLYTLIRRLKPYSTRTVTSPLRQKEAVNINCQTDVSLILRRLAISSYLCNKNKQQRYEEIFFLLMLAFGAVTVGYAQIHGSAKPSSSLPADTAVVLKGVTVEAARVTFRPDGRHIIPPVAQRASASNGYALLHLLSLPQLRWMPCAIPLPTASTVAKCRCASTVPLRLSPT